MASTEIDVPFGVGELVFAVDRQFLSYECVCVVCGGMGTIDSALKQQVYGRAGKPDIRPQSMIEWDDLEEDEMYNAIDFEDDDECPECDGHGQQDEDHQIYFPSEMGRIMHIDAQVGQSMGSDDEFEDYEEVNITIHGLVSANITGVSEMERTHQMARFYSRLKTGAIEDHRTVDRKAALTTEVDYIYKNYRDACKASLINNHVIYTAISDDLDNAEENDADYIVVEKDRPSLVHALQLIEYVQACIKVVFPDLEEEVLSGKRIKTSRYKDDQNHTRGGKITEKIEKPETQKSCEALVALEAVAVEEALL